MVGSAAIPCSIWSAPPPFLEHRSSSGPRWLSGKCYCCSGYFSGDGFGGALRQGLGCSAACSSATTSPAQTVLLLLYTCSRTSSISSMARYEHLDLAADRLRADRLSADHLRDESFHDEDHTLSAASNHVFPATLSSFTASPFGPLAPPEASTSSSRTPLASALAVAPYHAILSIPSVPRAGPSARDSRLAAAAAAAARKTRPLNRAAGTIHQPLADILVPKFRRGFAWSDSSTTMSPAALDTETAPPLATVPPELLNNPYIAAALARYKDQLRVDTPFNVDRLETMLHFHPNQPLVRSVIRGLREGFWPFHNGDLSYAKGPESARAAEPEGPDLDALRAYRDKEIAAQRWSAAIPELMPGMTVSPLFVVWQNEKPRVITDHKSSGLNGGIPAAEGHVRYDDMHDFGQSLRDARREFPTRTLITYKSDVKNAFLNLPCHPIWQLQQVVQVDGKYYFVWRLVFGNLSGAHEAKTSGHAPGFLESDRRAFRPGQAGPRRVS
ncbi:hypothetical protein FIBSPDRAFT_936933 [Athelia psychrophila]|uniref:Reverse transcriptase domain-containing protein n=1 Tax=Athelia psychrophila TaxID=1759441 RepID=A0A166B7D0_9AGAM|nr:hypothetical protein FIBSPDRAFT_936933 [Fibularhizoctonia sp. CBS 109695]